MSRFVLASLVGLLAIGGVWGRSAKKKAVVEPEVRVGVIRILREDRSVRPADPREGAQFLRLADLINKSMSVRKELGLNALDVAKINKMVHGSLRLPAAMGTQALQKHQVDLSSVRLEKFRDYLGKSRYRRLQQLDWQCMGSKFEAYSGLFIDNSLNFRLKLTPAQYAAHKKMMADYHSQAAFKSLAADEETTEKHRKKIQDLRAQYAEKFRNILTTQQQAHFRSLCGEPLKKQANDTYQDPTLQIRLLRTLIADRSSD